MERAEGGAADPDRCLNSSRLDACPVLEFNGAQHSFSPEGTYGVTGGDSCSGRSAAAQAGSGSAGGKVNRYE